MSVNVFDPGTRARLPDIEADASEAGERAVGEVDLRVGKLAFGVPFSLTQW